MACEEEGDGEHQAKEAGELEAISPELPAQGKGVGGEAEEGEGEDGACVEACWRT